MELGNLLFESTFSSFSNSDVPYLYLSWVGFNGGSALAANAVAVQAFLNTQAAAASAMLTWLFMDYLFDHKLSASGACIGKSIG